MAKVKLVVFDVAGTTATDDGLVVRAFENAMLARGIAPESAELRNNIKYVEETMGQRKIDVFLHITQGDAVAANSIHEIFIAKYNELVAAGELKEFDGISELFAVLRANDVGVAITTGFPRKLLNSILRNLEWRDRIDISVASDEVERGRPAPDMIFRALDLYANMADIDIAPEEIAVVGDTQSDMESGVTAGARFVIGVTSGAHPEDVLRKSGASHVLDSATQLLTVIN